MREKFNKWRIFDRLESGELTEDVESNEPAHPRYRQVPGTKSQMVGIYDRRGFRVALIHQFLKPDGTLGGSGQKDPKAIFENGTKYYLPKMRP